MKILSPLASNDEVDALIEAGADEFYCGYFPAGWYERWGRGAWPNRRGPGQANLASVQEVAELAEIVHAPRENQARVPLYLALNQQHYPDDQADFLLGEVQELAACGAADAIIVSDPAFMAKLRAEVPTVAIFASTVAVALNADSVRMFTETLGCERVILSRHLHLDELRLLRQQVPEADLEVFLLNDNCYFEEGFCSTTHTMPGFGVYCMTPWEVEVRRDPPPGSLGKSLPIQDPEERARWDFLIEEHSEFQRHLAHRGHGTSPEALPLGPCGLCAIPELVEMGISSGKIVGREASLYRKIRSVQAIRHLRDLALEAPSPKEVKKAAVDLRGDPQGCAAGYSCYYREARDRSLIPLPSRPRGPRRPPRNS